MRSSKSRSRNKSNRQRTLGNIVNRVFDSSGPEGKVRGTPQQIIEKYLTLARDAQLSNDRVAEQSFLQHAEHYTRMLGEAQREMAERQQNFQSQRQDDEGNGNGDAANGNGHGHGQNNGNGRDHNPRDQFGRDNRDQNNRDQNRVRDQRDRNQPANDGVEQPVVAKELTEAPAPVEQPVQADVMPVAQTEPETGSDGLVETPEAVQKPARAPRAKAPRAATPRATTPRSRKKPVEDGAEPTGLPEAKVSGEE